MSRSRAWPGQKQGIHIRLLVHFAFPVSWLEDQPRCPGQRCVPSPTRAPRGAWGSTCWAPRTPCTDGQITPRLQAEPSEAGDRGSERLGGAWGTCGSGPREASRLRGRGSRGHTGDDGGGFSSRGLGLLGPCPHGLSGGAGCWRPGPGLCISDAPKGLTVLVAP